MTSTILFLRKLGGSANFSLNQDQSNFMEKQEVYQHNNRIMEFYGKVSKTGASGGNKIFLKKKNNIWCYEKRLTRIHASKVNEMASTKSSYTTIFTVSLNQHARKSEIALLMTYSFSQ